ncbi:MAG: hypothetical protein PHC84_03025 [Clostridia bacterium]|nr:hypothetical protein [Clostridia bacterium]
MPKNPFITLGISENVTQNELYDTYKELRERYSKQRFAPGDEGAEACIRLEEVEAAYAEATEVLRSRYEISNFGDELSRVEDAIKENNLEKAQGFLDAELNRTAKWHYLQSVIFFRRGWNTDAYKQLEFACSMEPQNPKYAEAKEALFAKMTEGRQNSYNPRGENERSYRNTPPQGGAARGCTPCDCCSSLICADCCCECAGGDLISCC